MENDNGEGGPDGDGISGLEKGLLLLALASVMGGILAGLMLLASSSTIRSARNPLDVSRFTDRAAGHVAVRAPDSGGARP